MTGDRDRKQQTGGWLQRWTAESGSGGESGPPAREEPAWHDPTTWEDWFPLIQFTRAGDQWTVQDSYAGTVMLGAPGTGKTTYVGWRWARGFLEAGFGGLVLTAKVDEAETWARYAQKCGRSDDLLFFGPDHLARYNFLECELAAMPGDSGAEVLNLSSLIDTLAALVDHFGGASPGGDKFWEGTRRQLLRNTIRTLLLAEEPLTMLNMARVVDSAPIQGEQFDPDSYCFQLLDKARKSAAASGDEDELFDFRTARQYWERNYGKLSDRTRSSVKATFDTLVQTFQERAIHKLFSTETTLSPDDTFIRGKIIVLDMALDDPRWGGETGRVAQALFRILWQRSLSRRDKRVHPRPVFCWIDEAHDFVGQHEQNFQTKCRDKRVANVFLTQNATNFVVALGGPTAASMLELIQSYAFLGNHGEGTMRLAQSLLPGFPLEELQFLGDGEAIVRLPRRLAIDGGRPWLPVRFQGEFEF